MSLNPAIGDLLSVRFQYTNVATGIAMNVLHFKLVSSTGTLPNQVTFLTAVAGQCLTGWGAAWCQGASDQVSLVSCRATSVFPLPRSVGVEATNTVPKNGDVASEALPLQDSITILKRTAVGNRWGLGRLYYVGIPENGQSNGIISADEAGLISPSVDWLNATRVITGSGWSATLKLCLVRGPEDNPVSITDVVGCQVSGTILKSQKRRRPGKGI